MRGKELRETVGLLLVVASMVFVGVQVRQTNKLAQAAAYQAIGIASAEAWDNQAHDREFLMAAQGKEAAAMDTIDWRQRAAKYTVFARLGEMVKTQVDQGLLPDSAMYAFGFAGWQGIFQEPTLACIWPLIRGGVSPSFRQWVEEGKDPNAIDCSEFAVPEALF